MNKQEQLNHANKKVNNHVRIMEKTVASAMWKKEGGLVEGGGRLCWAGGFLKQQLLARLLRQRMPRHFVAIVFSSALSSTAP